MNDWYDENIERGVRNLVRLLRNNGWNTTSSCEHRMNVVVEWYLPEDIEALADFLQEHGYDGFGLTGHISVVGDRRQRWLRLDVNEYSLGWNDGDEDKTE